MSNPPTPLRREGYLHSHLGCQTTKTELRNWTPHFFIYSATHTHYSPTKIKCVLLPLPMLLHWIVCYKQNPTKVSSLGSLLTLPHFGNHHLLTSCWGSQVHDHCPYTHGQTNVQRIPSARAHARTHTR